MTSLAKQSMLGTHTLLLLESIQMIIGHTCITQLALRSSRSDSIMILRIAPCQHIRNERRQVSHKRNRKNPNSTNRKSGSRFSHKTSTILYSCSLEKRNGLSSLGRTLSRDGSTACGTSFTLTE